jgi:hypothetical protein
VDKALSAIAAAAETPDPSQRLDAAEGTLIAAFADSVRLQRTQAHAKPAKKSEQQEDGPNPGIRAILDREAADRPEPDGCCGRELYRRPSAEETLDPKQRSRYLREVRNAERKHALIQLSTSRAILRAALGAAPEPEVKSMLEARIRELDAVRSAQLRLSQPTKPMDLPVRPTPPPRR